MPTSPLVVAWYERWSGKLAAVLTGQARDTPSVTPPATDTPVSQAPVRPWAPWRPQPQAGWTLAGDAPVATPPSALIARPWSRWLPQPQYGWVPAGDVPTAPPPTVETPSSSPSVLPWRRGFVLQPCYGWSQASDQD